MEVYSLVHVRVKSRNLFVCVTIIIDNREEDSDDIMINDIICNYVYSIPIMYFNTRE